MKRKQLLKKLLFFCAFLLPLSIIAQTITGKVTDTNGEAISFATVVEEGTSNGTTSDMDGNFSLTSNLLYTLPTDPTDKCVTTNRRGSLPLYVFQAHL